MTVLPEGWITVSKAFVRADQAVSSVLKTLIVFDPPHHHLSVARDEACTIPVRRSSNRRKQAVKNITGCKFSNAVRGARHLFDARKAFVTRTGVHS